MRVSLDELKARVSGTKYNVIHASAYIAILLAGNKQCNPIKQNKTKKFRVAPQLMIGGWAIHFPHIGTLKLLIETIPVLKDILFSIIPSLLSAPGASFWEVLFCSPKKGRKRFGLGMSRSWHRCLQLVGSTLIKGVRRGTILGVWNPAFLPSPGIMSNFTTVCAYPVFLVQLCLAIAKSRPIYGCLISSLSISQSNIYSSKQLEGSTGYRHHQFYHYRHYFKFEPPFPRVRAR